jgi:hypothetical protein
MKDFQFPDTRLSNDNGLAAAVQVKSLGYAIACSRALRYDRRVGGPVGDTRFRSTSIR